MTPPKDITGTPRSLLALARSLPVGWWLLAIVITSGTDLLDFFAATQPNARQSPIFLTAVAIRIFLVFWLGYALIRKLADQPRPMKVQLSFLRYSLFMLGLIVLIAIATAAAVMMTRSSPDTIVTGIATFLVVTLVTILLIRFLAWQAALAIGDRTLGPRGAWRHLRGITGRLVAAYLIIAAVAALHGVLTRLAIASRDSTPTLAGLALVDGVVSAVQLVLSAALAVLAWRLATRRAGALREGQGVA